MMGPRKQRSMKLFYTGLNLDERVPADHPLRRITQAVSFDRVRSTVAHCYGSDGHVSLDPVVTLKLMLLLFIENVRSERELMRVLPMRLDWLWFLEMDLDDDVPTHSVLSKARRRWGLNVFALLFDDVLRQCIEAGLVDGEAAHADSTVLRANASVDSRVSRQLWEQLESGLDADDCDARDHDDHDHDGTSAKRSEVDACDDGNGACTSGVFASGAVVKKALKHSGFCVRNKSQAMASSRTPPAIEDTQARDLPAPPRGKFNARTVSTTDPDAATMRRRGQGVTLGYRDHCLVDDKLGIITSTIAMPADYDDGTLLKSLLDEHARQLGGDPKRVTGDCAYGTKANVAMLRKRRVMPYVKPRASKNAVGSWLDRMPAECPRGAALRWLGRRLAVAEGRFASAKTRHGHARCRWRRRWRVQMQCYLVAMTQNLLKLTRHGRRPPPSATSIAAVTQSRPSRLRPDPHVYQQTPIG